MPEADIAALIEHAGQGQLQRLGPGQLWIELIDGTPNPKTRFSFTGRTKLVLSHYPGSFHKLPRCEHRWYRHDDKENPIECHRTVGMSHRIGYRSGHVGLPVYLNRLTTEPIYKKLRNAVAAETVAE